MRCAKNDKIQDKAALLEILKGHVFQKRRMSQHKISPFFLINPPVMLGICFFKGLRNKSHMMMNQSTLDKVWRRDNIKKKRELFKTPCRWYSQSLHLRGSYQIQPALLQPFASPEYLQVQLIIYGTAGVDHLIVSSS